MESLQTMITLAFPNV